MEWKVTIARGIPRQAPPDGDFSAPVPAGDPESRDGEAIGTSAGGSFGAPNDRLGLLIDHFPDIVLLVGDEGVIVDANRAAEEAYGWQREQLVGQHVRLICHDSSDPECAFARALFSGQTVTVSTEHRRRDGSGFAAEVAVSTAMVAGRRMVLGIVRDVTARRRRQAFQAVLHGIDQRILKQRPLEEILGFACEGLVELYGVRLAQIAIKSEDGSVDIRECAGAGVEFLRAIRVRWDDSPHGEGPTGTAIRTGKPQRRNLATDPGFRQWREEALALGLRSAIAFPLAAHGQVAGALTLFTDGARGYDTEELEELRSFADQVALSLLAAAEQDQIRQQRTALEAVANGVLITDAAGLIRWVNPAFTEITGWVIDEVRGKTPRILKSGNHPDAFYREMWETLVAGRVWSGELFNRRKDGALYVQEMTVTPVSGSNGRPASFVAVMRDVTERKRHEESLLQMALHDPLTDLPNRRALEAALDRVSRRAGEDGPGAAMLLIDLDDFKAVNDTYGHLAGDQVLLDVSAIVRTVLRPADLLARLGGDEFAILLEATSMEDAAVVAERLRVAVEETRFSAEGRPVSVSVSVGVAPIPRGAGGRHVLRSADLGLYSAKGLGKNRVCITGIESEPMASSNAPLTWPQRIEDAVVRGRLEVHYQPVVRLSDGAPVHFEALVRMLDDEGLVILPAEFLGPAERFGLMTRIDLWVVEEVLSLLSVGGDSRVFVNLSGASLSDEHVLAAIEERILAANLAPGRLAFEITESSAITDLNATRHWIRRLKGLGCLFALDDFGVGFSSFAYLKALPVDYIKIDQSFVRDVATNPTTRAVVDAVQSVARSLGKGVIAEGVESDATATLLRELGIEHAQGFRWGRPCLPELLPGLSPAPAPDAARPPNGPDRGPAPHAEVRMKTARSLAPLALLALLLGSAPSRAKDGIVEWRPASLAPVKDAEAVSVHSPYGTGDCSLCHEGKDPKTPGKAIKPVNEVCFYCHEDLQSAVTTGKYKHTAAVKDCTVCHNPHNAKVKQLLVAEMPGLCTGCHTAIDKKMGSKVKHDALTSGRSCSACHSPHASGVEKVLLRLPFDQCVGCHSVDGLKDSDGKVMTNFGKLLAENPVQHAPIESKDCSACHEPHGSEHTRMSAAEYPPQFYAPFDPTNYALCFTCHDEKMATLAQTTTDTRFRDGSRNLHFLHVNKAEGRGRTCRACHEVHASKQPFLIRESVPFGPKGWLLNVGFRKDPNGGTCDKTCHASKSYVNTAVAAK